jgi:hypothetical protein
MNGGLTYSEVRKMRKRDFLWFLERLRKQKERENKEIEKASQRKMGLPTSGKMKYLGR